MKENKLNRLTTDLNQRRITTDFDISRRMVAGVIADLGMTQMQCSKGARIAARLALLNALPTCTPLAKFVKQTKISPSCLL